MLRLASLTRIHRFIRGPLFVRPPQTVVQPWLCVGGAGPHKVSISISWTYSWGLGWFMLGFAKCTVSVVQCVTESGSQWRASDWLSPLPVRKGGCGKWFGGPLWLAQSPPSEKEEVGQGGWTRSEWLNNIQQLPKSTYQCAGLGPPCCCTAAHSPEPEPLYYSIQLYKWIVCKLINRMSHFIYSSVICNYIM